jgi:ABC-type nitrate/sulfonate/bicarbonate transport system permease component
LIVRPPATATEHVAAGAKKRMWWRLSRWQEPVLVAIVVLGLAEALIRSGLITSSQLPPPSVIAQAFFEDIQHAEVWQALESTMVAWAIGLAGVIIIGVPLGMALGMNKTVYGSTQPTLEFVRTVPSIAALPLLILLLGISLRLAVVMVLAGALWPVLIQTMYGVQDVDPAAKDVGRAYGLGRVRLFTRIVLPSSFPYIATGIRLAAVIGLLLSVSASLLAGGEGIGYLITKAMYSNNPGLIYARIALTGIAGLLVSLSVTYMEKKLLFWHPSQRKVLT